MRLTQVDLGLVVFNIMSGAVVRLTDSGLGCPNWPDCSQHHITPPLSFHPAVEFANRMVVVALCVAAALTVLAAWRRTPRRRDLVWLSGGLVAGIVGEAVIGAFVVYSKLNPYVVMTHFMVGIVLLTVALLLALRAGRAPDAGAIRVRRPEWRLSWACAGLLGLAIIAGTATTAAGPHAGGAGAKRLPVPLSDMARTHSGIVLCLGAMVLFLIYRLEKTNAPASVRDRVRMLLFALVVQGLIGYTQYFTHLPAALVAVHVFGATVVWSAMCWYLEGLRRHVPEASGDLSPTQRQAGTLTLTPDPAGSDGFTDERAPALAPNGTEALHGESPRRIAGT